MQNSRSFLTLVSSCLLLLCTLGLGSAAAQEAGKDAPAKELQRRTPPRPIMSRLSPRTPPPRASVNVGGHTIDYQAVAGTILVGATNDADASVGVNPSAVKETPDSPPTARMFYVAYFKKDAAPESRPVTFIYNGGPGSSTMWLHMGAFGPRRVITADDQHTNPAPYRTGRQCLQPARRQRPGLYRRARHRLRPALRQGQGKGFLGSRSRRACLCPLYRTLPLHLPALELAQIPLWRELRHHPLRDGGRHSRDGKPHRPQWRHSAFANPELRR